MSQVAIQADSLGKQYRIGASQPRYQTLRETVTQAINTPLRQVSHWLRGPSDNRTSREQTVWALQDVSFEVRFGEVVGIIGRNGAGKTTLLKILSRITEPTTGHADVYGRVGSLLEVGTGFHPELTGRENIYLNGAILGMRRAEMGRKFDEIVAFAGIEPFIDTPVKHYSSGMYVRLAFAVAAHLEPEILVVDEVLAVGDAAFQKKCLGKMEDVARGGRTVLLVSHNMAAIRSLCQRAILLDAGQILLDTTANQAVQSYLSASYQDNPATIDTTTMLRSPHILPDTPLRVTLVHLHTADGVALLKTSDDLTVSLTFVCTEPLHTVSWVFSVVSLDGLQLFQCVSAHSISTAQHLAAGQYTTTGTATNPLAPGRYILRVGVRGETGPLDHLPEVLQFSVEDNQTYTSLPLERTDAIFRVASIWQPPTKVVD